MSAGAITTAQLDELIGSRKPGYALPQRFYIDPDIYALELARIVRRNWVLAGHTSEWPAAGDFRVVDVANESAIVVRGDDGTLSGFANVCRHRGSRVCLQQQGNCDRFICPYHGWTYDMNGNLVAARSLSDDVDRQSLGLRKISVGEVHGLVFTSFSADPPALNECRRELAGPMAMFGFPDLKIAARKCYEIPANWKLAIENYQECYHCTTAHPEYAEMHTLTLDPGQRKRVQAEMLKKMAACGLREYTIDRIDTAAEPGQIGYGYSRTALFRKYKTGSKNGKPVAPLLGSLRDYDGGASDFSFGAFSFLLAYSDYVVCYVFTPTDHHHSRCEITWLVRGDADAGSDYDVKRLIWLWDITMQADIEIIVNNAKGVHSAYYEPGPLSNMERAEGIYLDWLLRELKRP